MVSRASGASDQSVWGLYRCEFSWRVKWDHRRPCPTSAAGDFADLVKSSFGSLRGLWSGSLRCLWMHLFKPVPMIPSAAMSDIGGHVRHQRPDISLPFHGGGHIGPHIRHPTHCPLLVGGRGLIKTCRLLTAAALSSRSDVIRIAFSLPM